MKKIEETYETEDEKKARLSRKLGARAEAQRTGSPIPPALDWDDDETTDILDLAVERARASHEAIKKRCDAAVERWADGAKKVAADG